VSEFLMGEVDSSTILSIPPSDQNQTMESLYGGIAGPRGDGVPSGMDSCDTGKQDGAGCRVWGLCRNQHLPHHRCCPESLLSWGKAAELVALGLAQSWGEMCFSSPQTSMPFLSIYLLALEQDMEHGASIAQAATALQQHTFLQPLIARRMEHEKRRKEIKEQWHRAQRKLQEAEGNLRKAKQTYMQRSEEHDKAKYVAVKAEEEQQNTTSSTTTKTLDKKRRLEEEAKNKVGGGRLLPGLDQFELLSYPSIQPVECLRDCDSLDWWMAVMDEVSKCPSFPSTFPFPLQESQSWMKSPSVLPSHPHSLLPSRSPFTQPQKGSFNASEFSTSAEGAGAGSEGAAAAKELPSGAGAAERRGGRGHQVHKSWPTSVAEADSSLDSNAGEFSHKLQRLSSNGTASSSEELEEKDGTSTAFEQSINGITPELAAPTGPFRNVGLSKAAQTHRLRKLRAPSKCRECNSYVYFQGAECEECNLACHKKCLETLAIQCGHKKLQGKLQL
ncbi:HMHA1 protein, partial [Pheucticus melanocephalus]|nr:HMHA1 protein [Pheucticus melanocephalus]